MEVPTRLSPVRTTLELSPTRLDISFVAHNYNALIVSVKTIERYSAFAHLFFTAHGRKEGAMCLLFDYLLLVAYIDGAFGHGVGIGDRTSVEVIYTLGLGI